MHILRVSNGNLKKLTLQEKLMVSMLSEKVEVVFASKVTEIVRKRQPKFTDMDEWDPNEVSTIRSFNENIRAGVQAYCALKRIYESEFDDIEQAEKVIKLAADAYATVMLEEFGWIKEKEMAQ